MERSSGGSADGALLVLTANQFNSISKRVVNVAAPHARNIIGLYDFDSRIAQQLQKRHVIAAAQRGMCLPRGTEVCFGSQMNLYAAAFKPASAAFGEFRRFRYFSHAEKILVKCTSAFFLTCGHGELNVIDGEERRVGHVKILEETNGSKGKAGLEKRKASKESKP
jgi:hypothetical protein